ncbi:transposon Tf2-9 polyprotein [Trichonephila clavipes]|nr:transposon Tf2-9 polyprotein [Trichonephila clavipes]
MGAVLTQLTEQGEEHPILYLSKKFSEVEKRYCTTEKECASIVFAIKRLHYYLDGNSFLVMTDHNPLVWLNRNVSSNPRLMRWALALQPYNFRIVHRSDHRQEVEPMDWEDLPFLPELSAHFVPSRPPRKMRSLISVQVTAPLSLSANHFPNMRDLVRKIIFDPSSFTDPTPLAHADISRDVLPWGGTSQWRPTRFNLYDPEMRNTRGFNVWPEVYFSGSENVTEFLEGIGNQIKLLEIPSDLSSAYLKGVISWGEPWIGTKYSDRR